MRIYKCVYFGSNSEKCLLYSSLAGTIVMHLKKKKYCALLEVVELALVSHMKSSSEVDMLLSVSDMHGLFSLLHATGNTSAWCCYCDNFF